MKSARRRGFVNLGSLVCTHLLASHKSTMSMVPNARSLKSQSFSRARVAIHACN